MGPCSPCPGERNPNRDCRHRKTPPHSRRPTCRRAPSLPKTRGGSPQQALISNRSKECGGGCGTMVFVTIAGASFGSSSRAGRSLGRRRPASVPRRLRPNPRQTYFVILSVSEGSIWGKVTDSSSIFRSPQNDNAVFALNHSGSGTHSSARPGRLRGSRFQREPAPGARLQTLKLPIPHCSQTPQQTGICNWRQRRKGGGKRCSGGCGLLKYNPALAVRAEAPPCGDSQNSLRRLRHENISNTALKTELGCGSRNFASYPVNNKFL